MRPRAGRSVDAAPVRVRVDEDTARSVCLVRAAEELDRRGRWFPLDERRAGAEDVSGTPSEWLPARSRRLADRLRVREPGLEELVRQAGPSWVWAIPVGVFGLAAGLGTQALGAGRDVHLLAPPLFALLAWNVLVLVGGAVVRLASRTRRTRSGRAGGVWLRAWKWFEAFVAAPESGAEEFSARVRRRFLEHWLPASQPLVKERIRRLLHLGALATVLGVVAGMYVRGLALDYRVSWESTFLSGETVEGLASTILGPAAVILGTEVPPAAPLRRPASGPAAPWIHLWAVTAGWMVVFPRSLFLGASVLRAARLARALPVDVPSSWIASIRGLVEGRAIRIAVRPYSFEPEEAAWRVLRGLLQDLGGPRADVARLPTLAYGDDPPEPEGDLDVVVLPLAQTPEVEVHGELLAAFRRRVDEAPGERAVLVLIDAGSFRRRLGGTDLEESLRRLEERRRAWSRVVAEARLEAVHVDLATDEANEELLARIRARTHPQEAFA